MRLATFAFGVLWAFSGCFFMPTNIQRTGTRLAPLPADCPITFVDDASTINQADYSSLGHVTRDGDRFTDDVKSALREYVCDWGGDTVTIMTSAAAAAGPFNPGPYTTFSILRKREGSAAVQPAKELPCLGKYVNSSGASLVFFPGGNVAMEFSGSQAQCQAQATGDNQVIITCSGMASPAGSFSSDCTRVNYGGMDFTKQ